MHPIKKIQSTYWFSELYSKEDTDLFAVVPKNMLSATEIRFLYWLGNYYFENKGIVIDAGCFIGGSTVSLCAGLARNPLCVDLKAPIVHSIDLFITPEDTYTRNILEGFAVGESFRPVFDQNTELFKHFIDVHPGDFSTFSYEGGPIEILFLDICKCWETTRLTIQQFFKNLIPGRSILIQQDYFAPFAPWVHLCMAHFDYMFEEIIDIGGSKNYLCIEKAREADLSFDPESLSLEEKFDLLSRIKTDNLNQRIVIDASKVLLMFFDAGYSQALNLSQYFLSEYGKYNWPIESLNKVIQTIKFWNIGKNLEADMVSKFKRIQ